MNSDFLPLLAQCSGGTRPQGGKKRDKHRTRETNQQAVFWGREMYDQRWELPLPRFPFNGRRRARILATRQHRRRGQAATAKLKLFRLHVPVPFLEGGGFGPRPTMMIAVLSIHLLVCCGVVCSSFLSTSCFCSPRLLKEMLTETPQNPSKRCRKPSRVTHRQGFSTDTRRGRNRSSGCPRPQQALPWVRVRRFSHHPVFIHFRKSNIIC